MAIYTDIEGQGKLTTGIIAKRPHTITITRPTSLIGDCYFTLEAIRNGNGEYDSTSPVLTGVFANLSGISTLVSDTHKFAAVIDESEGSFTYTPDSSIGSGEAYVRGTGEISVEIL